MAASGAEPCGGKSRHDTVDSRRLSPCSAIAFPRRPRPMTAYLIRRLWQMVPTLLGVVLLVFLLFKFFGGDPAEILAGQNATPRADRRDPRAARPRTSRCGLQLWIFLKSIVTFDWGRSWATNESVAHLFATRLPATLTVMMPILVLDTLLAIPIALRRRLRARLAHRPRDHGASPRWRCRSRSWSTSSSASTCSASSSAGSRSRAGATALDQPGPYAPLPVLLAVLVGLAPQTRLYRSFFLDEIGHDYVRTARAKGMTEKTVLFKHVLRNALIPILTNIGLGAAGHLRRLVPDRGVLLDPRARPRGAAGRQPQRLPGDPGGHDLPGGAHDGRSTCRSTCSTSWSIRAWCCK